MPVPRMMALRRHFWTKIGGLALMALAFSGAEARAQIINQNDYIPLPPGTNIALGYYQFSQYGDVNIIGKGTESKSNLVANIMVSRYVHYFKLGHFTAAVQALLPFGAQSNANVGGEPLQPTFGAGDLSLGAEFGRSTTRFITATLPLADISFRQREATSPTRSSAWETIVGAQLPRSAVTGASASASPSMRWRMPRSMAIMGIFTDRRLSGGDDAAPTEFLPRAILPELHC